MVRPQNIYPQGSMLPSSVNISNGRGNSESEDQKHAINENKRMLSSSFGRTSSRHLANQQSSSGQPQYSLKYPNNMGIKHSSFHHDPSGSHPKPKHLPHKSMVTQQDSTLMTGVAPSSIPSGFIPPGFVPGHQSIMTSSK